MHTDITSPQWGALYQPVGHTLRRPLQEKRDPKRPKYVTGWNDKASSFLMISKIPRIKDLFLLEVKTHFKAGAGFLNFESRVHAAELAMLADIPHTDVSKNNVEVAARYGAEFYAPGVFLRRGDEVVLLLPDRRNVHYGASIQIKEFFTRDMNRMLRFGRVDVESKCEEES